MKKVVKWKRQARRDKPVQTGQKPHRTKAQDTDKIGRLTVFTAHRDLPDFCSVCFKDVLKGQLYVNDGKNLTHYYCRKNAT